ncbi:MAG TPA: hypothetical protein VEG24_02290, partial [Gaiellaceae bacterium]|nr:hypothetical protein [Gaiellaceae bacterium]
CTATVVDTRDAFATGLVRLAGSGSSCRLRAGRSVGVAACKLRVVTGVPRLTAVYGGDRLDLASRATATN